MNRLLPFLASMLAFISHDVAMAASPTQFAASIEKTCVSHRPRNQTYEQCLASQQVVCERTRNLIARTQLGDAPDCALVLSLVAKDEAMAAAKQGVAPKAATAQTGAPSATWRPNQSPASGTFAVDNILSYLPTPDPTSEGQCVELIKQQKAELSAALGNPRLNMAYSAKWSLRDSYRDHLARNGEIHQYVKQHAPSCLKNDLLVIQVWMEAIGLINAMPYSDWHFLKSNEKLQRARAEMQAAVTTRTQQENDARQAGFDRRKQAAMERGAPHLFGIYLGAPVEAAMPTCKADEHGSPQRSCWAPGEEESSAVIHFSKTERPDYLEDIDPTHVTPGYNLPPVCISGDCFEGPYVEPRRGKGRIVAIETVASNVERIHFRISPEATAISAVSDVLSKRLGAKPTLTGKQPKATTATWRNEFATASMVCDANGCAVSLQSVMHEETQKRNQRRRALEVRPL